MVFHGSNLKSYEEGSFSTVKPIGSVTLSLHNLFLKDQTLVSKILHDVSKKETSLIISDAKINSKSSVQPFEEVKLGGTAVLTLRNITTTDEEVTVARLNNLNALDLSYNTFIDMPEDCVWPAGLSFLNLSQNNFVCTCEFVAFLQHDVEKLVKLQDGPDSYVCDSPLTLRGNMVQNAQLSLFECHMIPAISILCAGIFLTILLLGFTCHKLHVLWYLRMTWAWIQAKRRPAVSRSESVRYDAFVSYSEHDAEWVEEVLVPELEGNQPPFALCLHKRDFQPGRWIVDNIIDCIEKSHCTLYVLSEHFVTSEWCRYELDFSHFRLIDEKNDSAVLILLEPIEKETIPKRFCKLRKVMNSKTYLEWPEEEEKRAEFWHNLKAVLQREESSAD
ncbi:toll-like receptor 2 type-2 [Chanos chanos]|uniref:Toll-like receptor 2 type-2 n=1 Tax=Chanos chanos TaxID=29144 RepID=A0A6J2VFZ2_CHACN|nr:toll-like receptor 2 type-2 [Chanos chanos]